LSLGLHSVELMDKALSWIIAPWTNPIGGGLLALRFLFHMALGLRALFLRNTLRMSQFDAFQLLLGLSIPVLMFPHIIFVAMVDQHLGYQRVLSVLWVQNPVMGLRQVIGLMVVWLHSCMGLFIWMRLQAWWGKVSLFVYPTVGYQATTASTGDYGSDEDSYNELAEDNVNQNSENNAHPGAYKRRPAVDVAQGNSEGSESAHTAADYLDNDKSDYANRGDYSRSDAMPVGSEDSGSNDSVQFIGRVVRIAIYGWLVLVGLVLAARALRLYPQRGQAHVRIGDATEITIASGASLLEISRLNDIAHASLCGGKGRCGTCQVAIVSGQENLTAPTGVETQKLKQINAAANIRLACQARVSAGAIEVEPILPAYVVAKDMPHRRAAAMASGEPVSTDSVTDAVLTDSLPETGDQS